MVKSLLKMVINPYPFRVHWTYRYVQCQGQVYGHLSKYLIYDLIYQFFQSYMKKSSKSSLKERSLDISLQHKNEASYKFSKKKLLHLAKKRAGAERVKWWEVCWHTSMNFENLLRSNFQGLTL